MQTMSHARRAVLVGGLVGALGLAALGVDVDARDLQGLQVRAA
jgi:hypothetical protein